MAILIDFIVIIVLILGFKELKEIDKEIEENGKRIKENGKEIEKNKERIKEWRSKL